MNNRGESIKAPSYNGEGDVELFVGQFEDVCQANGWSDRQALLHLRSHLSGAAAACGGSQSIRDALDALRARFGMTEPQAKEHLRSVKRDPTKALQEEAWEIARVVEIGYPRMNLADRERIAIDIVLDWLDNHSLRVHLLATKHTTLAATLEEIELHQATTRKGGRGLANIRAVSLEENAEDPLLTLTLNIERQTAMLTVLLKTLMEKPRVEPPQESRVRMPLACFQCGGPHMRKECPQVNHNQGNAKRPAQ
jgi:hypothetical protein